MSGAPAFAPAFATALGTGAHWGTAAKACLDGVAGAVEGANLGFLYATEEMVDELASALTFLRETTRIPHWVGAVAPGVCAGGRECRGERALAVMVGRLPAGSFSCFTGAVEGGGARGRAALVHAAPDHPAAAPLVAALAAEARLVAGGLVSAAGAPAQVADTLTGGPLSGLLLGPEVTVVTGLTQGCSPIGPRHVVTDGWHGVVKGLDGRPALDVLTEEAGELFARDIRRVAGYIHVALPAEGGGLNDSAEGGLNDSAKGGGHDYQVRSLIGLDRRQGWLAVGERVEVGRTLMLVRRDANGARADLARMLKGVEARLAGRRPLAALYVSCVARGAHMFGEAGAETALVARALGGAPLAGFFANGEIAGGRLFSYTGVLAVILGEGIAGEGP